MAGTWIAGTDEENFKPGRPVIVCRWRLAGRSVVLENRHLRALGQRLADGQEVSPNLVAWAKQHIEWTLPAGAVENPDGVLMLVIDDAGQAVMSVGPYQPPKARSVTALAHRADAASREARSTRVAPESLWLVQKERLVWGIEPGEKPSGSATLMADLAKTVGIPVVRQPGLAQEVILGVAEYDEAFLVSDEHGIVCATDAEGPRSRRFSTGYEKLLKKGR